MITKFSQEPYCINLDWLQFSVHLPNSEPELICPDGYRLELCQGNNIFKNRALLFTDKGQKVLTMLWTPYSKVLPANIMSVQVANEYLYMSGLGIKWAWELLQEIVECTFNAIGRVDICIDFNGSEERTRFIGHLNSNHYYVQGKSEGSNWWHSIKNRGKQQHCLTWGAPKSEIKVKLYHKSREQGVMDGNDANADKPWIVSEWQTAGMNITNVWRLEFSLCGVGQLQWNGQPITLELLQDEQWVAQVLCELYSTRFITRINQGTRKGHKNLDRRVYLIPLPAKACHLKWQDAKLEKTTIPPAITLLRSMMRQVDNPAIIAALPVYDYYTTTIRNIIRDYALEGYFRRTYNQSSDEYFEALKREAGEGIHTAIKAPAQLMD